MSATERKFSDENIASLLATQTAIVATLCKLLIKKGALTHADIVQDLRNLLSIGSYESPQSMGPLMHLLSILEESKDVELH